MLTHVWIPDFLACLRWNEERAQTAKVEGDRPFHARHVQTTKDAVDSIIAFLTAPILCPDCKRAIEHNPRNVSTWSGLPPNASRKLFHARCYYGY